MSDPDDHEHAGLVSAAAETAALAAAVAGWPAALVSFDDQPAPVAAQGLDDLPGALARARTASVAVGAPGSVAGTEVDAAQGPVVVQPLPSTAYGRGLLAVFGPPGAQIDPNLPGRLAALGRGLAARIDVAAQSRQFVRIAAQVPGMLYQYRLYPDGHSAFPFVSEGIREVCGVAPEAVLDDASVLFALCHPGDVERVIALIAQSASELTLWDCEYRVCLPGGRTHWLHGRAMPERLADGGTLWHGFITRIDARKQAEQALRRSEHAFRQFFEAGLVGMTIADPDLQWREMNGRMARMLGYTPEELRRLSWADFTHPGDVPVDQANYARLLSGEIDGYVMDKRYVCKDGSLLECRLAVRCERAEDGNLARVFAVVEDISDWRRAEHALQVQRELLEQQMAERTRELVAARDAAQQASRAKSEFLSSMSHELRTPLNAILGFSQLIDLDRDLGERSRGQLREVLRAGRHLLRLINEVLDLAQVESGRLALSPEPLRLHELVDEAAALTDPMARPRGLRLQRRVAPELVVLADRMRLKQVLLNLLSNAAKYGRPGSQVVLEAAACGPGSVRLTVSDQGPGIAPELLDLLFKPFSRLGAERGTVEGAGIGLALSRRLMELMGGRIGVDSRPGEGADFWIELPTSALAAPPPPADAEAAASGWQALSESLVLYVEDNPANLALVQQIVARHSGIRLVSASDGAQGLTMARAQLPALILLDIQLPVMDGYELLARLRADLLTRDIPVVAVTAQAMPSDARRAIEAGFDEYIAKPIDVSVFDTLLRRLLGSG